MKKPLNDLASNAWWRSLIDNVISNLVANALPAVLLALGVFLWHDRRYAFATLVIVACAVVFGLVLRHRTKRVHRITVDQLHRHLLDNSGERTTTPLINKANRAESFELAMAIAATMLQADQMDHGFWGKTILRYGDLHFRLNEQQRRSYGLLGSLSHCAHALRGLETIGIQPLRRQELYERLRKSRRGSGEFSPLDEQGQPVTTNLSEAIHELSWARHTSTGAVSFALVRGILDGDSTDAEEVLAAAVRLLLKHVERFLPVDEEKVGYTHAYVLEASVYAYGLRLAANECRSLAGIMTETLLHRKSFDAGYWEGGQQKGQEGRSTIYFSALIAERLLWACQAGLIQGSLRQRALDAVRLFLETALRDFTNHETGAVMLDATKRTDFGTTARCACLALRMEHQKGAQTWVECIFRNLPNGLVDENAHTHTWEAFMLLGIALLDDKAVSRIRTRVEALQSHHDGDLEARLLELVGPARQDTIGRATMIMQCK